MAEAILHLGGNQGDIIHIFASAIKALVQGGCSILQVSALYETEPWGNEEQDAFINQSLLIETEKSPYELLHLLQEIETTHGRIRRQHWGPRTLDIDILFYEDRIIDTPELTIPHPRLQDRNFVLVPLIDIAADKIHPIFHKTIKELYLESRDLKRVSLHLG